MRVIDKIALNRLVAIVANFILSIVKIFAPKAVEDIEVPDVKPERKRIFPIWRKKKNENSK